MRHRHLRSLAVRIVLPAVVLAGGAGCRPGSFGGPTPAGEAVVERIVDGDTLELEFAGRSERVRLLGIDTPETVDETRPVQCFGPEASARLAALVPPGSRVRVERDVEARDRFGRLLLYLYRIDDGLFVNGALVDGGYATTLSIAPNTARAGELAAARARAQRERRGLWGACPDFGSPLDPRPQSSAGTTR